MPRLVLLLVLLAPLPATAQSLTLLRQTAGDYAFETRVDTADVACPEPPARLFLPDDTAPDECATYGRRLVVRHRGVALDSISGMWVWLGAAADSVAAEATAGGPPFPVEAPVPPGAIRDLTGDGVPEIVVTSYSGGMHCCTTHFVVSLGETPRALGRVDAAHGDATIADADGDGVPEIALADWTFGYWNESFAGSPAPRVVLAWDGEQFAPSERHMRQPPLPDAEVAALVAAIRSESRWTERHFPPTAYWATLLDLLYAGRSAQAAHIAEAAWVGDTTGRTVFLTWLAEQLWRSPYGPFVVDLNADALDWL